MKGKLLSLFVGAMVVFVACVLGIPFPVGFLGDSGEDPVDPFIANNRRFFKFQSTAIIDDGESGTNVYQVINAPPHVTNSATIFPFFDLNGTSQRIFQNTGTGAMTGQLWSVSTWFLSEVDDGADAGIWCYFNTPNTGGNNRMRAAIRYGAGDHYQLNVQNDSTFEWAWRTPTDSTDIDVGTWVHMGWGGDATGVRYCMINGATQQITELVSVGDLTFSFNGMFANTTPPNFVTIGVEQTDAVPSSFFNGPINYFRDWDGRMLSEAEMLQLFIDERVGHGWINLDQIDPNFDTLVASWSMEYADACPDTSGNKFNGILSGPTWAVASSNGYYDFNGINSKITKALTATTWTNFAIMGWVFPDVLAINDSMIGIADAGAATTIRLDCGGADGNDLRFIVSDDGVTPVVYQTTNTLTSGVWQHIAATWTSGGVATVYVDAVAVGSTAAGDIAISIDSADSLDIGGLSNFAGRYFNGRIDDFRPYANGIPSAAQLLDIVNETASVHP